MKDFQKEEVKALDKVVYTSTAKEMTPDLPEDEEIEEDTAQEFTDEVLTEDASDIAVVNTPENEGSPAVDETADKAEYNDGYALGADDALNKEYYQANLDVDESDMFKHGYADGYNDRKVRRY